MEVSVVFIAGVGIVGFRQDRLDPGDPDIGDPGIPRHENILSQFLDPFHECIADVYPFPVVENLGAVGLTQDHLGDTLQQSDGFILL